MKHMYELREQYKGLMSLADELPPDALADTLELITDDLETKGMQVSHAIKMMDTTVLDAEIDRLKAMKKRIVDQREWLESYLRDNMTACDITNITWDTGSVSLRAPTVSCVITNPDLIPNEYREEVTTVKIDKNVLKRELRSGVEIPGCELVDGKRGLMIK